MAKSRNKLEQFIENANAFQVMAELRREGLITKEDMTKAMGMGRAEWLVFMKQKAGIEAFDDSEI